MRNICLSIFGVVALFSSVVYSQVRPAEKGEVQTVVASDDTRTMLETIDVKYQGGLFGYNTKEHGTIRFDDINERLSFYGIDGKERFSIPYNSLIVVFPSKKKIQSGTGKAVGAIPFPGAGLAGGLLKKNKNYLVLNFDDLDIDAKGAINFLVDTKVLLANSIFTIGEKAEMRKRGDSYIRKKDF